MKVTILKSVLESILINSLPFLEKKDLSQITSHIYLHVEDDKLHVKATDFEIGLKFSTSNIKISDAGDATVNGKKFLDIVKSFKEDDVTLETINNYLYIKQNSSKFKLPMMNPLEYPSFPEIDKKPKFDIEPAEFIKAVKKITPAIDNNNPKFELNGALIDIKENYINLVAKDTKRLAVFKKENKTE
ncbi:MAG: DNA polymerase III subunit beta [Campylobacteraceae bacterium]